VLSIVPLLVALVLGPERQLAVASNEHFVAVPGGYVAFWSEGDTAKAARIALDGDVVARATLFSGRYVTGAAADGDSVVIVTQRLLGLPSAVEVFRIGAALTIDAGPVLVGAGTVARIAAAGDGNVLVGWQLKRTEYYPGETLVVSQFDASLALVRQRVLDLAPAPRVGDYVLAPGPFGTLVVWNELTGCEIPTGFPCGMTSGVRAAVLTPDLTIATPRGIDVAPRADGVANAWWDGTDWEIVYDGVGVLLSRVSAGGALLDTAQILGSSHYFTRATPLGGDVVVASDFVDSHGGAGLTMARVRRGATEDSRILLVVLGPSSIAAGADGRLLLSYHRYPGTIAYYRIVDFNAENARPRPVLR
jgi:hypothetical protein